MHISVKSLALLALVACSSAPSTPPSSGAAASPPPAAAAPVAPEYWVGLQPGRHTAVLFTLTIPGELGDVQTRFARAAATHQTWLQQYIEDLRLPPGAPLPYHPNLGVTEAEYRDLQNAYEHPTIVESERRDIDVRAEGGALRFSAQGPLAPLGQLVVEASGRVRYGDDLVADRPVRVEGQQARFGQWTGFSWQRDESDRTTKQLDVLELALGQVAGRRFIHLARRKSDGVAMTENIEVLAWVE